MTTRVVTIELRYRARADESISERHERLVARLRAVPQPWGRVGAAGVPLADIGDGLEVQVDFSQTLTSAMRAYAAYVFRGESYLRDEAEFDDRMVLEFDIGKQDYQRLVCDGFPAYVDAFEAYRGTVVLDEELAADDWEEVSRLSRTLGKDLDGRDGVFRIAPVGFFDHELCRRAFCLTPSEVVSRLAGHAEYVRLLNGGVLLIAVSAPIERAELEELEKGVRKHLGEQ